MMSPYILPTLPAVHEGEGIFETDIDGQEQIEKVYISRRGYWLKLNLIELKKIGTSR